MNTNNNKIILRHNQKEKAVFEFFDAATKDTQIVYLKNDDMSDCIPLRIQMIIAFSLLDVFSSYWCEYLGKTPGIRERFCTWYDRFCKTDTKEEYKGNIQWAHLSSSRLYSFRCSLVHFLGMSDKAEGVYMALAPNDLPEEKYKVLQEKFMVKGKSSSNILIKPHSLHNLIKQGGKLMLEEWIETIKKSQGNKEIKDEYIKGIERVYKKVMKEGAAKIKL